MRCFLKNVCPQEELASWECEILIATLKVHSQNGANWFSTKSVTEAFNTEKLEREKVKTMTIGRQIRQFGFRPHRSAHRKGWRWDEKLVTKLKERYPIAESAVSAKNAVTRIYHNTTIKVQVRCLVKILLTLWVTTGGVNLRVVS